MNRLGRRSTATCETLGRIGKSSHGIRIVRLDSDAHSLLQQYLDPNSESDDDRHPDGMDLPITSVDAFDLALVRDDLGCASNRGTVLASHITDDVGIPRFLSNKGVEMGGWMSYGLGDEVFMVGRLLDHDGEEANDPSIRTGIISMFPCKATDDELLIECRSIGGYSGAPVFACVSNLTSNTSYRTRSLIRLIGMNRGHVKAHEINTGMTFVVPSWRILELLNSPEVIMESEKIYKQHEEAKSKA